MKKLVVVCGASLVLASCVASNIRETLNDMGYRPQRNSERDTASMVDRTEADKPSKPSNLVVEVEKVELELFGISGVKDVKKTYILDQNGCKHSNPQPVRNETITWSGKCVNGYASGQGTQQWYNDGKETEKYVGDLKRGKRYGKGTYEIYGKGQKYVGDFKDGKSHGKGTTSWANPCSDCLVSYTGEYENGYFHGQGKGIYADGDEYDGRWEDGKKVGDTKFQRIERDRRYERTKDCKHLYVGRVYEQKGALFTRWKYVVEGFSESRGLATVRDEDGRRHEVSCSDIPE